MAECLLLKAGGGVSSDDLTAKKGQVLSGYTAVTADSGDEAAGGTMPNHGELNWSESNTTKTVAAGYYSGGTLDSRPSYNKGVSDADGRVNSDSESYKKGYEAGYSAGISFADGRVNTNSESYKKGYQDGYEAGKQYVKEHPDEFGLVDISNITISTPDTNNGWGSRTFDHDCIVIFSGTAEPGSCGHYDQHDCGHQDPPCTGTQTNISTTGQILSQSNWNTYNKRAGVTFSGTVNIKAGQGINISGRHWGSYSNNNGAVTWTYTVLKFN